MMKFIPFKEVDKENDDTSGTTKLATPSEQEIFAYYNEILKHKISLKNKPISINYINELIPELKAFITSVNKPSTNTWLREFLQAFEEFDMHKTEKMLEYFLYLMKTIMKENKPK